MVKNDINNLIFDYLTDLKTHLNLDSVEKKEIQYKGIKEN